MAYKDLHKLKKIAVVEKEIIKTPFLVVGKDIFSLSLYKDIKKNKGLDQVRLLSEDIISEADLFPKGPSTLRGETNQKLFKEVYPQVEISKSIDNALFYKEMAWKSFGGRSKSEILKYDEGFYTGDRIDLDFNSAFSDFYINADQLAEINSQAYQVKIKSVKKSGEGFIVECINGTEFHTEELFFGLSPYKYLQFYKEKNELSDEFMQFCESTKTSSALFVKFLFTDNPLSEMKETLFIPLSYTHDWGHFIGEFKSKNGHQEIEFMHFLEDQIVSEEDVSRIIRLLKKSMEKIFPSFLKINVQEFIALEQEIGCLKIDDSFFKQALESSKKETNNLTFIGINAPITEEHGGIGSFEYSKETLNNLMRGLIIHENLTKKFK